MAVDLDAGGVAMTVSAGFCGEGVRSDARVTVERIEGPNEVLVRSRVAALYGRAIEAQARDLLAASGVQGVRLRIEDEGALPFALAARIETALARAGFPLPPLPATSTARGPKVRSRRTRLYVPADTPRFAPNAALHQPDALILDLEDSVPPGEKDAARFLARRALRELDFGFCERMIRINAGEEGRRDLEVLLGSPFDTLILPKAESAEDVRNLDALTGGSAWILPLIETARGIQHAAEMAEASPNVVALSFGMQDLLTDLGAEEEGATWALGALVIAARSAGLPPLGPVLTEVDRPEALRERVLRLAKWGFEGVSCVHPLQVAVVHDAFAPTPEEVDTARRLLDAYDQALASGRGSLAFEGRMVDAPIAARAEGVLRRAGVPR